MSSNTRSIKTGSSDNTLRAIAYNTDGSVKSDLAYNTSGISIYLQRKGAANGTPFTLSAKATPETAHADGAFLNLGGGDISVDVPDAPFVGYLGEARIYGTFTGGTIVGEWYDVVAYDAQAVAVGANTTTPPTAAANATAVRSELTTELARIDVAISTRLASASYTAPDNASVTAIKAKTDNLPSDPADASEITAAFTEIKGAGWSSATDTLEKIRDASGSTSIMVTPVVAQVPVRVRDTDIETYIGDLSTIRIGIFSGEDAVDLSGFGDLEVCVQAKDGTDLDFVEMADLTIDGTDNNYVSWDPAGPSVATIRRGKWSLRKSSNKQVIAKGAWIISDAALEDTGS